MKEENKNTNKSKATKIAITSIFVIIILILFLIILNLRYKINNLVSDNEKLVNLVHDLDEKENAKQERINEFVIDDVDSIKKHVTDLSEEINNINQNYTHKDQFVDLKDKVYTIAKLSNEAGNYNFEQDIKDMNNIISSQKDDMNHLQDTKEDKINKVDDITSDPTSTTQYPSVVAVELEKQKLFDAIYPVGSVYVSLNAVTPEYGEWVKLESERVLWNTDAGGGDLLGATLPNVSGRLGNNVFRSLSGPFYNGALIQKKTSGTGRKLYQMYVDFSRYNSIYQNGATVRPPAITVTMFKRVS